MMTSRFQDVKLQFAQEKFIKRLRDVQKTKKNKKNLFLFVFFILNWIEFFV